MVGKEAQIIQSIASGFRELKQVLLYQIGTKSYKRFKRVRMRKRNPIDKNVLIKDYIVFNALSLLQFREIKSEPFCIGKRIHTTKAMLMKDFDLFYKFHDFSWFYKNSSAIAA